MHCFKPWAVCLLFFVPLLPATCAFKKTADFSFDGGVQGGGTVLYGLSPDAVQGLFVFSKNPRLDYVLDDALPAPSLCSLELEYEIDAAAEEIAAFRENFVLTLEIEGKTAWELPLDIGRLGLDAGGIHSFRYVVPLTEPLLGKFSVYARNAPDGEAKPLAKAMFEGRSSLRIRALRLTERWYGFARDSAGGIALSPFVYREEKQGGSFVINVPDTYAFNEYAQNEPAGSDRAGGAFEVSAELPALDDRPGASGPAASVQAGKLRFEYLGGPFGEKQRLFIPAGALPGAFPVSLSADVVPLSFKSVPAGLYPFPQPIPADPGVILSYPQGNWRDKRFEVFRWEGFPSILIFDTADYAIQDDLFKRLAFFTEKAGFRGRLMRDSEIEDKHGWNAHDYRAESLADFFETARDSAFPLLPEERLLEEILVRNGVIIRRGDRIEAGEGAVISISRQSSSATRNLLMTHEAYHGIFFLNEDFRQFSLNRFNALSPLVRRFTLNFIEYQAYDSSDEYLLINEFMAYIMQQAASQAGAYFGGNLAGRLNNSWRRTILPPADGTGRFWPEIGQAFEREARAFSAYTRSRWNLSAGRVSRIRVTGESPVF
ncbi:MAG: hypothetical protein LBQ88_22710 [Treponema sp.]|jgi:hypothetical protein|nr:hypothetical protein [Treponema sp.]